MSTRANIIIKDSYGELIFYRHSDGYPSVTLNSLLIFMRWIKERKLRDNIEQSAGWLIALGMKEYNTTLKRSEKTGKLEDIEKPDLFIPGLDDNDGLNWKIGAYEPSTMIHGDIEYLYTLTIDKTPSVKIESVYHSYNKDYSKSKIHKKTLGIVTDFYHEYDNNLKVV